MTDFFDELPKIDAKTGQAVNYIFDRLSGIIPSLEYSAKNKSGIDAKKREYTYALMDAKINNMQAINNALKKISKSGPNFLPTPAEFIKYCQPSPEDIGAPEVEIAFGEAALQAHPQSYKSNWSHPAVKHAYQRTGNQAFLTGNQETTYKKFEANYLQACLDYAAGKIMDQIEAPEKQLSRIDRSKFHVEHGLEFAREGVLKQYEHLQGYEDSIAVIDKILGKGDGRLRSFVAKLEQRYKAQGLVE